MQLPPAFSNQLTSGPDPAIIPMLGVGRPLATGERDRTVGSRLPDVRIHDDNRAQALTALLRYPAFTAGNHIALNTSTISASRDRLLAHELVHVLQQNVPSSHGHSRDSEREAENLAEAMVHGRNRSEIYPHAAPRGFAAATVFRHTQDLGNDLLLIIDASDGDFVGGCVKAVVPHLGVKLVKKGVPKAEGNQLFDIHVGIVTNAQGKSCFFFYESVSKFCEMKCFPTLEELKKALSDLRDWIKEKVEQVLRAVLPVAVAVVVAYVIAYAVVAALAALGLLAAAA
jgi:hypothetical protein